MNIIETFFTTISTKVYAANPPQIGQASGMLDGILDVITPLGGLLVVGMIVMGGYMYMVAAGDPQKTQTAQGTITWAIIGLVFLVTFRMILAAVFDFLGN